MKEIEILEQQISKLSNPQFDIEAWKSSTNIILSRIFGPNYEGIKSINKIQHQAGGIFFGDNSTSWDNVETCKKQGREILDACIQELRAFGIPEKIASKDGIHITLTQNQHQTVNIDLLVSALKDELTGAQLKEVKDIMNTKEPAEEKRTTLVSKLKSFGTDVASNVLANILTNPGIWG